MTTAFQTGPGFYAANSNVVDNTVPPGKMRSYCARIEAYDGPLDRNAPDNQVTFKLLMAMGDEDPRVARALLSLAENIQHNRAILEAAARRG